MLEGLRCDGMGWSPMLFRWRGLLDEPLMKYVEVYIFMADTERIYSQ